jgi:hypothetical protein
VATGARRAYHSSTYGTRLQPPLKRGNPSPQKTLSSAQARERAALIPQPERVRRLRVGRRRHRTSPHSRCYGCPPRSRPRISDVDRDPIGVLVGGADAWGGVVRVPTATQLRDRTFLRSHGRSHETPAAKTIYPNIFSPASMWIAEPVIAPERSEHRKATANASSSGRDWRLIGCRSWARWALNSGVIPGWVS